MNSHLRLIVFVAATAAVLAPASAARGQTAAPPRPLANVWVGPEGESLPFRTDREVLEFLRTAEVVSSREIPVGITHPRKVLLEKDGVRAHAVFRSIDLARRQQRLSDGQVVLDFKDSHVHEVAAYVLSELLELHTVPPVVPRRFGRQGGSLQLWIENAITQRERIEERIEAPEPLFYQRQLRSMAVFDNLIDNLDRNQGNALIDRDWKVWYIDHTRAFSRFDALRNPEKVVWVERRFWRRLREVEDQTLHAALDPYLERPQLRALLERRRRLIALIEQKIAERGEEAVVFTLSPPESPPNQSPSPRSERP